MATDTDILATLRSIEKLISGGASTAGLGRAPQQQQGGAGTGLRFTRQQAQGGQQQPNNKSFQATSAGLDALNKSAGGLGKTFDGLSKTVYNTRANFVSMNRSMRAYTTGQATANVTGGQQQTPQTGVQAPATGIFSSFVQGLFGKKPAGTKAPGQALGDGMAELGTTASLTKVTLIGFGKAIAGMIAPLAKDMIALQSAGINATSAIGGLYLDAAKAGMSLADYTKLLDESNAVVSRSSSMDDFNKKLTSSVGQLNNLGIFGSEATGLAAQLATSATTLGITQGDLNKATDPLISQFANLQKSVGMSVTSFAELEKVVSENENVQDAMVGMTKQQRIAALGEFVQTQALGRSLGGTKAQSDALAKSLLDQRNVSVEDSFKGGAAVNQAAASFGMNGADARNLADALQAPIPSEEQKKIIATVGAEFEKNIQSRLSSNNIQERFLAQQFQSLLPANFRETLNKVGRAATTGESGPNQGVNVDFAHGASDLVKGAGFLLTASEGFAKNPIAASLVTALSTAAFTTSLGWAIGNAFAKMSGGGNGAGFLSNLFGGSKGAAGVGGAVAAEEGAAVAGTAAAGTAAAGVGVAGTLKAAAGTAGKTLGVIGAVLTVVTTIGGAISDWRDADKREQAAQAAGDKSGVQDAQDDKTVAKGEGVGAAVGAGIGIAISGAVAFFTGGIGLALAGFITSATTALGAWIGNWWGHQNTVAAKKQDENTKATTANTKSLDTATKATTDTSEQTLTSVDGLTAVVMKQGTTVYDMSSKAEADKRAAAAKQEDDSKKAEATKLTPAELDKLRAQANAEANPSGTVGYGDGYTGDAFGSGADARYEELVKQAQDAKKNSVQAQASAAAASEAAAKNAPNPAFTATSNETPASNIATPAPSPVKTVTPPPVNTQDVAEAAAAGAASATPANAPAPNPVPVATDQMAMIVKLLQDLLATEEISRDGISTLASQALRPSFADSTSLAGLISRG